MDNIIKNLEPYQQSILEEYQLCEDLLKLEPKMDIKLIEKETGEYFDAGEIVTIDDQLFNFHNKKARKKFSLDLTEYHVFYREYKSTERLFMEDILRCLEQGDFKFTKRSEKKELKPENTLTFDEIENVLTNTAPTPFSQMSPVSSVSSEYYESDEEEEPKHKNINIDI